jgi:hypothetical protein
VTSEKAQIQALLNGIDEVLNKTSPRLPWVMSGDAVQQRQILEQTRQYLLQLQLQLDENPLLLSNPGFNAPAALPQSASQSATGPSPSESAQQVLQAVLQEMNYWRVNMLQPLRSEIDSLQRQREMLTQELRQLEVQRQQHTLPQQNQKLMMEFLQSAMLQMQANLSAQVSQQVSQMVAAAQPQLSSLSDAQTAVSPADRMAQIQTAQTQTDQLMLKLDATVQRIFESLSRNLQTYEASLEQGLHRMHDLGQQGEAMYAFLMNRMAQQLGREASSMLQATGQPTADQPSLPPPTAEDSPGFAPSEFTVADFLSQVPNQVPSQVFSQVPNQEPPEPNASVTPFNLTEDVLDIAALDEAEMAAAEAAPTSANLEALHQELDQLNLAPLAPESTAAPASGAGLDLFAGDQPLTTPLVGQSEATVSPVVIDEFDSALDLLNQLSAEMQLDGAISITADTTSTQIAEPAAPTAFVDSPDALYGDDFSDQPAQIPAAAAAVDATTLAQEWFGGLGDPAEQQPSSNSPTQPPSRSQFSDGSVSQSLESFLLNDAPPASRADLVIDPREAATPAEAPETIASLFDLLPEAGTPADSTLQTETGTAAPSPELSVQEAAPEAYTVDLGDSLQAFQQDFQVTESAGSNPVLEGGWEVFSDLPTAVSHPASSIPAVPTAETPEPSAAPVESLDGLFADVPDLNASTGNSVPSPAQVLSDLFAQFRPSTPDSDPSDAEKKN